MQLSAPTTKPAYFTKPVHLDPLHADTLALEGLQPSIGLSLIHI